MSEGFIRSMTGYGYMETQDEKHHLFIEVKSYNNRYLDLIVTTSVGVSPLEPRIRELLSLNIARGRVEAAVKVRELEEDIIIHLDKTALKSYLSTYAELIEEAGLKENVQLNHLLSNEEILKKTKHKNVEDLWQKILPLLLGVIDSFNETRRKEGAALSADIRNQLNRFEAALTIVEGLSGTMETVIRETLEQKLKSIFEGPGDESRIMTEIALLLVKYSINEEIVRLKGHIKEFLRHLPPEGRERTASAVQSGGDGRGVGKKLDFICQELNREINTIASKSVILEVNQAVVEMKDSLENIREQLRNVE